MHRKVGRAQQWNHVFRQHRSCHAHCFSSKLYFHNVSSGSSVNSVRDFGDLGEDQILFFRELGVNMSWGMGSLGSVGNPWWEGPNSGIKSFDNIGFAMLFQVSFIFTMSIVDHWGGGESQILLPENGE